jgi:hypothetical protein
MICKQKKKKNLGEASCSFVEQFCLKLVHLQLEQVQLLLEISATQHELLHNVLERKEAGLFVAGVPEKKKLPSLVSPQTQAETKHLPPFSQQRLTCSPSRAASSAPCHCLCIREWLVLAGSHGPSGARKRSSTRFQLRIEAKSAFNVGAWQLIDWLFAHSPPSAKSTGCHGYLAHSLFEGSMEGGHVCVCV